MAKDVPAMRLSLSVRVAESFHDKTRLALPFPEVLATALASGYEGLCLRASVVSVHDPVDRAAQVNGLMRGPGCEQ
jgi:hypothetical protein